MAELSWSPDDQHLAWSESRPTTVSTDTSAVTDVGVILDVRNGQTRELPEAHGGLAWSPDTTKVAAWTAGGIGLIPIDGGATTTLPASGYSDGPLLWSSNGDAIAAVSPCEVPAELDAGYVSCSQGEVGVTRDRLLIFDMSTGSDYRFELRDYPSDAAMLAWREPDGDPVIAGGAPGVARGPDAWTAPFEVNDRPSPGTGLQVITGSTPGPRYVEGVVGAQQLLTSAAVVELAPPAQPLLSTTFLGWVWSQYWHWTMPVVAVLLAVLLGWAWRRRRVRSQWVFDPT
jgi:hypothetical protein